MSSSTLEIAAVMHCFRSSTLTGSGGRKILSLIYPHKKKNHKALDMDFLVANVSVPCSCLLSSVWNDLDYRIDICHVTKVSIQNICNLVIQT
jgi:hypothetical protein